MASCATSTITWKKNEIERGCYLELERDDFPQFPQESSKERHHRTLWHCQGTSERQFILGGQEGGGEIFQNRYWLVHALPKRLQLVGSATKRLHFVGKSSFSMATTSRLFPRQIHLVIIYHRLITLYIYIYIYIYVTGKIYSFLDSSHHNLENWNFLLATT